MATEHSNPSGLCQCGCGAKTKIAQQTNSAFGHVKGYPIRFVIGHHTRNNRVDGYKMRNGRLEHVQIAEKALGRRLRGAEEVHHVDDNTLNNANSNLVICQSRSYHMLLHARARVIRAGGNPETEKICKHCNRVLPLESFYRFKLNASNGRHSFCKECDAQTAKTRRSRHANQ